jgi:hypothetical protein
LSTNFSFWNAYVHSLWAPFILDLMSIIRPYLTLPIWWWSLLQQLWIYMCVCVCVCVCGDNNALDQRIESCLGFRISVLGHTCCKILSILLWDSPRQLIRSFHARLTSKVTTTTWRILHVVLFDRAKKLMRRRTTRMKIWKCAMKLNSLRNLKRLIL